MKNTIILILLSVSVYLAYQQYYKKNICLLPQESNAQIDSKTGLRGQVFNANDTSGNEVSIYTTSSCPNCKMAKSLFDNRGIRYTNYDIDTSKENRTRHDQLVRPYRKNGQIGVPLIIINRKVVYGFNEQQILAALR